jgi:hypothetical protein
VIKIGAHRTTELLFSQREVQLVQILGILTELIELQFLGKRCVPLFRCKCVDIFNKKEG